MDLPHEDLTANAAEGNQAADLAEEDAVDDPAETTRRYAEETVVAGFPEEDADTEEDVTEGGVATEGNAENDAIRQGVTPQDQDVAPQGVTAKGVTPQDVTAQGVTSVAPQDVTAQGMTLQDVTPQSLTAQDVTARGVTVQDVIPQGVTLKDVTSQGVTAQGVTTQSVINQDVTTPGITIQDVTTGSVAGDGGAADGGATIGGAEDSGATEGGAAGVVVEALEGASGDRGGERHSADGSSALDWGGSLLGGGAEDGQRGSARKGRRGGRRAGSKGRRSAGRSWLPDGPDEESQAASTPPADPESVARAIVLRLLTMAPKTRAQLAEALRKRDVPEEAADAVLDRFSELGLINDEAFAEAWVDSRHHGRGLAKRALAAELRHRGVDNDTVKEAVERLDSDQEAETARRLVDRKLASTRSLDPQTRTRRLAGMLARKGYSSGLAYRVIREALDEEGIDVEGDGFP
ncbi:regulatory protein RecX [Nonomuraea bangladeshensis]